MEGKYGEYHLIKGTLNIYAKRPAVKAGLWFIFLFMVKLFGLIFRLTGKVKSELSENRRINL